jgi:DNA-binding GntR family transcriptional regulator
VLRFLILRGHFDAQQPLRQDEIATQFGVSRIPVRESLRQLTAEGLVQFEERRGATVAALLPDEAEELLEIRYTLEIKAATLALPHWTESTFSELSAYLKEAESSGSIDRWSDLNRNFHDGLYEPCARARLLGLIGKLNANVERYIRLLVSQSDYRLQAQREHQAILACARVGNIAALSALIEQHAMETAVQLRRFLSTHHGPRPRRQRGKPLTANIQASSVFREAGIQVWTESRGTTGVSSGSVIGSNDLSHDDVGPTHKAQ